LAICLLALAGVTLIGWLGLREFAFSDYELEALPAFSALTSGDVGGFLSAAPAYGGSLVMRAPFALLAHALGGGELAVYRAVALPCLLALGLLALVMANRARLASPRWAVGLVVLLVAANPMALSALDKGHPEELLGAVLCVAAVLAAWRERPALAGVLAGLAIANKPWALLALGAVVVALPTRRAQVGAVAVAGGVTAIVLAPLLLAAHSQFSGAIGGATHTSSIFQPWQAWWFLGGHSETVAGTLGVKVGYRAAPGWLSPISHPLIVLLSVPMTGLFWLRRRRQPGFDAMLLLAFAMLVRCLLDPWNTGYYALPFLLALLAWELAEGHRVPTLTFATTLLDWTTLELLPQAISPDLQALAYLAWSVPLAGALALRLYAPGRFARILEPATRRVQRSLPSVSRALGARPQPTVVSALSTPLSTSAS
jgi:hypothetical protein